jgi:large repetitive protein
VSVTDEDGSFVAGSKSITVNNVAPSVVLSGNTSTLEGATYTLNLVGSDPAGANDILSYSIDWGDGSAAQVLTAAELAALSGNVTHIFADDEDGPINATARTIQVTVSDEDGGSRIESKSVTVNNVAPVIALAGADSVVEDTTYTLTLGAVTDPGTDTVTNYVVNWGDGTQSSYAAAGDVTHTYADPGNYTISVDLTDEDGTFTSAGSKAVTVNAASATVSIEAGADATLNEGTTFTRTIAFSDGVDDGAAGWSYSIDYGDGTVVDGTTLVKSLDLSHQYADGDASHTVTVTVTDEVGETDSDSFLVTVDNVAPTIALTGADTVDEGSVYTLSLAALVDPGTDTATAYSIDWGDGTVQNFTAAEYAALAGSAQHTYADGGLGGTGRTIQVSVTDEDGSFVAGSKSITVNNVAPSVVLSGNASTLEGATYTLNLVGSDPAGANDILSYSIDWGDGSAAQVLTAAELAALSGNVTHIFADDEDGPINATARTIQVTVSDEDGGSRIESKSVTVNNVAPVIALAGADSVNEGATYTLTLGAVTDPGTDTVTNYVVNWGDGTSDTYASAGDVTHVYADGLSTPTITVDLVDEDGTHLSAGSKSITVNNVAPTASVTGADSVNEGSVYTLSVGAVVDPGADTRTAYSIDWGDGAVENFTPAEWAAAAGSFSHTYADGVSTPTISVSTTDEDGSFTLGSKSLTVNNVAPVIALTGADSVNEGATYTLTLGAVTDPGTDTVTSYVVNWGDGTSDTYAAAGDVTHMYADGLSTPTITVDLVDEDGTHLGAGSKSITVNNVAPTIALTGADTVDEGSVYTLSLAALVDPGTDTATAYSIDWGDGTIENFTAAEYAALGGTAQHTYADGGLGGTGRTIQVSVTDEDGSFVAGSKSITVNNVAPSVVLSGNTSTLEGATYTLNLVGSDPAGANDILSYSIDWGDGSAAQVLTAAELAALSGNVTHIFADDEDGPINATARTIQVTVSDEDGGSRIESKSVTVNNVAPVIALAGADSVVEDTTYTLTLGAVTDPGTDTVTNYVVNWGDGTQSSYAAAGDVTHTYADPGNYTISVDLTDEDGTFTSAGSKAVVVTSAGMNTAPDAVDDAYSFHGTQMTVAALAGLLANDTDADGDTFEVDSIAYLGAGSLVVAADGAFTWTPSTGFVGTETFTYTIRDVYGATDTAAVTLTATNEAPDAVDDVYDAEGSLTGAQLVVAAADGILSNDVDGDADPLTITNVSYLGSGSLSVNADGSFTYTPSFGFSGTETFTYTLTDGFGAEDSAIVTLNVAPIVIHLGDAVGLVSPRNPDAWAPFWTDANVEITHKANVANAGEAWSAVKLNALGSAALAGGDLYGGDLGVSGKNLATSTINQELQGAEALRFDLAHTATRATVDLSNFYVDDDANVFNYNEAGRLQALDEQGNVVAELTFVADSGSGRQTVTLEHDAGFSAVVVTAGVYDGSNFVFGAYADDAGGFAAAPYNDGKLHGSDFLLDSIEFELAPIIGVNPDSGV